MAESCYCRKCGTTEHLTHWFTSTLCESCRPQRCRICKRSRPEVRFANWKMRRCTNCARPPRHTPVAPLPGINLKHLAWIRQQPCLVGLPACQGVRIHAHHVRSFAGGAGMGQRPADCWAVPLCALHHREGHDHGWTTFEATHRVDLIAQAKSYARWSPFCERVAPPPAPVPAAHATMMAPGDD